MLLAAPGAPQSRSLQQYVRQSLVSGTAIILPVLVTLFVLLFALNFLSGLLDPFVIPTQEALGISGGRPEMLLRLLAAVALVAIIFVVGAFAQSNYGSGHIERSFEATMENIPGVGSVYGSLNQISEMLLNNDTESFQEVKLVEYPREGSYSVAFVTADTPEFVSDATGEDEMTTLFMPMGPNPVMGGFIIHVEQDKVYDVDLTVEEGVSSIVSLGVAIDLDEHGETHSGGAHHLDEYGGGV